MTKLCTHFTQNQSRFTRVWGRCQTHRGCPEEIWGNYMPLWVMSRKSNALWLEKCIHSLLGKERKQNTKSLFVNRKVYHRNAVCNHRNGFAVPKKPESSSCGVKSADSFQHLQLWHTQHEQQMHSIRKQQETCILPIRQALTPKVSSEATPADLR